jgi:hypothetical protein
MKTKWERFCDWLSGPEPEPLKSAWPLPEPIRPFVAKLVECIPSRGLQVGRLLPQLVWD